MKKIYGKSYQLILCLKYIFQNQRPFINVQKKYLDSRKYFSARFHFKTDDSAENANPKKLLLALLLMLLMPFSKDYLKSHFAFHISRTDLESYSLNFINFLLNKNVYFAYLVLLTIF